MSPADLDQEKSEVQICNLSLNAIGHTAFIASFDEDSVEANVLKMAYPQCRDEVLEALALPFSTRRSRPAPLDAATLDLGEVPGGWAYAYALPADCLPNGLRSIRPGTRNPQADQKIPFAVEYDGKTGQMVVLTDQASPEFVYTARITDTTRFPPTFIRVLAERLACEGARGIRKDAALFAQQAKVYAGAEATARASAARAVQPDPEPRAFFLEDRGTRNTDGGRW